MHWLVFAILAPVVYTIVNFTDKFVVARAIPDSRTIPIFLAIVHATIGTLMWLGNGLPVLTFALAVPLMLTGALVIIGTFMLFKALVVEETSKIVMWTQMLPVVILLLSVVVLDERLKAAQLAGFVVVFAATLGLSFEPGSLRPTPAFWSIMAAVLVWSASDILLKLTLNENPSLMGSTAGVVDARAFMTIINYQSWGFALGGLAAYLTMPTIRHAFNHRIRIAPRYALAVLFGNETVFILRQFIRSLAIALGPVALVGVLGGARIFLGIFTGWALTLIAPELFAENITREGMTRKIVFSIILFGGILLIALAETRT